MHAESTNTHFLGTDLQVCIYICVCLCVCVCVWTADPKNRGGVGNFCTFKQRPDERTAFTISQCCGLVCVSVCAVCVCWCVCVWETPLQETNISSNPHKDREPQCCSFPGLDLYA